MCTIILIKRYNIIDLIDIIDFINIIFELLMVLYIFISLIISQCCI